MNLLFLSVKPRLNLSNFHPSMAMSISRPNPYPINRIPLPALNQRIRCGFFIKSTRPSFRVPSSAFWLPNARINSNKISSIALILPGGSWWNLSDFDEEKSQEAKPVTLWTALDRMWTLIGDEQWIVYLGLGGLILAAVSEISMPSILAASIFSAETRAAAEFHRNARLLISLCIASGICSGLRSCCFAIASTILVKRFRETLYLALVFQGTGALINLLKTSWPLASPTLAICFALSIIVSVYGQYQQKAAKLTQEFNASANNTGQETLSMIRTVWVYGAEEEEFRRYKKWLDKVAFISIRESVAYGFWNMSFHTLCHSTQMRS